MATMRKIRPRKFSSIRVSWWADSDFLTDDVKVRLKTHLPDKWDDQKQAKFLAKIAEAAQACEVSSEKLSVSEQIERLEQLRDRARSLLQSLSSVDDEVLRLLGAHIGYLTHGSESPDRLSFGFGGLPEAVFEHWWAVLQDIETATDYATSEMKPDKAMRLSQQNARRLVRHAAEVSRSITGRLPPVSKNCWFPNFVEALGEACGLSCGLVLVQGVVQQMRKYPD